MIPKSKCYYCKRPYTEAELAEKKAQFIETRKKQIAEGRGFGRPFICLNVDKVRALRAEGLTQIAIAERFGVSINKIRTTLKTEGNERWASKNTMRCTS